MVLDGLNDYDVNVRKYQTTYKLLNKKILNYEVKPKLNLNRKNKLYM